MAEDQEPKPAHEGETAPEHRHMATEHHEDHAEKEAEPNTTASTANDEMPQPVVAQSAKSGGFMGWFGRHKAWTSVIAVVVVLAVLAGVPWTRYKVAGLFLKQTVTVTVSDTQTGAPVTSATVSSGGTSAKTDNHGQARLRVAVGQEAFSVAKVYYQSVTMHTLVPIFKPKHGINAKLVATGRQVPVTVKDKVNGKGLENATISAAGSDVKTDANGQATIVLPADKTTISATVTANGYNAGSVAIQVTASTVPANSFALTPSGQLYFLSNLSGKIDVVKTNLDGTNRQTVLAGTGKEDPQNTVLLATRDWKYLALLSFRDGGSNPKLFLIDTSTDKLTTMDEGNATFNLVGWQGHTFVYYVIRNDISEWQPNQQAIKSFNADTGKLATLDQTTGSGIAYYNFIGTTYNNVLLLNGNVVYATGWSSSGQNTESPTLSEVKPDGSDKKVIKSFAPSSAAYSQWLNLVQYDVGGLYINFRGTFYTYDDGSVKPNAALNDNSFNATPYPTFLLSPSGNQTFWSDNRDGKNLLEVGDADGQNAKTIADTNDYNVYGWYTDNYLLVSKNGSELYIMSLDGKNILKVSDYYKPARTYYGYGGGYGGL